LSAREEYGRESLLANSTPLFRAEARKLGAVAQLFAADCVVAGVPAGQDRVAYAGQFCPQIGRQGGLPGLERFGRWYRSP
jgi:hypothetical protein